MKRHLITIADEKTWPEDKKIANEKTQEIISAYELIKKHRGMR